MNEELKPMLDSWRVALAIRPDFQRAVWQRIAARESVRRLSWSRQFADLLFSQLATPRYATATILAAAMIGASVAHVQASDSNVKQRKNLELRYVKSIDPFEHISAN